MKTTQLLKSVAAATVLVGASLSANAAVATTYSTITDLGAIGADPQSFGGGSLPGPFDDIFTFTLPTSTGSGFSVANFPFSVPVPGAFNAVLYTLTLYSNNDGILNSGDETALKTVSTLGSGKLSFSYGPSAAGSYYLDISGLSTGAVGGAYTGAISVTPVPEPETFAMLLAGLGVMGAIARRRKV